MLKKIIPVAMIIVTGLIYLNGVSWAHGVSYEMVETSPAITFRSAFSSGEPIAYGEIMIYSPENSEVEYQNGRTDKNGVFSFLPDQKGIWKIEVNGGLGHKLMFDVQVSADGKDNHAQINKKGLLQSSQTVRAALGLSLLFNLALAALYLPARKKLKKG